MKGEKQNWEYRVYKTLWTETNDAWCSPFPSPALEQILSLLFLYAKDKHKQYIYIRDYFSNVEQEMTGSASYR